MMAEKRRNYTEEFKREAIRLVTEQGYGVAETARNLGINANMLGRWKREFDTQASAAFPGNGRMTSEKEELHQLRHDNKRLRMEREIVKNLVSRAASLVSRETGVGGVSSHWGRSGRQLTGGRYHPVKKRGPGTLADVRVVTPAGDPV